MSLLYPDSSRARATGLLPASTVASTVAEGNFWAQPPQRKSGSPFGKDLTLYLVYEGGMNYFRVLIHRDVWCALLLRVMLNLEELPIKLVRVFYDGFYETV